ncbi:MAG: amidohydrolase family protein [Acutalibacteraceae bacterium]|nr:amidohydrolase family protein [Acutalibacteraceae bacterium]
MARYGVDRVLFGTDYPMWSVETDLKRFYSLGYNKEDSDKILYQNAVKVYGLKL